jgi:hypothetical protein
MPVERPDRPMQTAANVGATNLPDFPRQLVHSPPPPLSNWSAGPTLSKPATGKLSVAAPAKALTPRPQGSNAFRPGGGLHLQIVSAPSGPAEASRINALIGGLRSQVGDIASATVTTGPAAQEIVVVYFFFNDHASARRIATSLSHIMKRHYKLMLGHAHPLPGPGTVEIRLPR